MVAWNRIRVFGAVVGKCSKSLHAASSHTSALIDDTTSRTVQHTCIDVYISFLLLLDPLNNTFSCDILQAPNVHRQSLSKKRRPERHAMPWFTKPPFFVLTLLNNYNLNSRSTSNLKSK